MTPKQVKSRRRVADHGEVFTARREVESMLDLVKAETERVESKFLEPACGDGNFLEPILNRKLAVAQRRSDGSPEIFEKQALIALGSVYGVELLTDNAEECRARLFDVWNRKYSAVLGNAAKETIREKAREVLRRNIVRGNFLTYQTVDENGQETGRPILFTNWTFVAGEFCGMEETLGNNAKNNGGLFAELPDWEDVANATEPKSSPQEAASKKRKSSSKTRRSPAAPPETATLETAKNVETTSEAATSETAKNVETTSEAATSETAKNVETTGPTDAKSLYWAFFEAVDKTPPFREFVDRLGENVFKAAAQRETPVSSRRWTPRSTFAPNANFGSKKRDAPASWPPNAFGASTRR